MEPRIEVRVQLGKKCGTEIFPTTTLGVCVSASPGIDAKNAGDVYTFQMNAGDVVQPGTALYTVVDPGSMQLEASVPADQLSQVRVGMPVDFKVTGYPNRNFTRRAPPMTRPK